MTLPLPEHFHRAEKERSSTPSPHQGGEVAQRRHARSQCVPSPTLLHQRSHTARHNIVLSLYQSNTTLRSSSSSL